MPQLRFGLARLRWHVRLQSHICLLVIGHLSFFIFEPLIVSLQCLIEEADDSTKLGVLIDDSTNSSQA